MLHLEKISFRGVFIEFYELPSYSCEKCLNFEWKNLLGGSVGTACTNQSSLAVNQIKGLYTFREGLVQETITIE